MADKKGKSLFGSQTEVNLHWKILGLVNDRLKPVNKQLQYDKGSCKTCVSKCNEPKTQRPMKAKQIQEKSYKPKQNSGLKQPTQISKGNNQSVLNKTQTMNLIKRNGTKLGLFSNLVKVNLDCRKTQLFDQTKSRVQRLNQQISDQQKLIIEMEKQMVISQNQINELNRDIESIRQFARDKAYSDNQLNYGEALSETSLDPTSLKEVLINHHNSIKFQPPSIIQLQGIGFSITDNYEYLLRIICTQAKELQRQKQLLDLMRSSCTKGVS